MVKPSIAQALRLRLAISGLIGGFCLLVFVVFDIDQIFDDRYHDSGVFGVVFELADHVVLPLMVALAPLMLAMPWVVQRSLTSLELAARRINTASGQDRGFRVALDGLPAEAVPFAAAVNDLLERLDRAAERQEAFASDIAHELKTPLAVLRLELEQIGDPLGDRIRADVVAMNRLVDQLLLIAQLDAEALARTSHELVSLHDVAAEVSSRIAATAIRDGKKLELAVMAEPMVRGRREAISAALRNLVENAIRVTEPGKVVRVIVGPGERLRVQDGGPGLTPEHLASLSQRLCRADHASREGAGLGLAIVAKVMASHAGTLETDYENREIRMVFG